LIDKLEVENMSEKKVGHMYRNMTIVLGIICVVLLIGLAAAYATYTSMINSRDNTIMTFTDQNNQLQTWVDGNETLLNQTLSQYNNYVADHHHTDEEVESLYAQITNLQNQIKTLTAASLTTVGLDVSNFNKVYPWDPASHLTINGYIFNMGTYSAYNSKLHVQVWSSTNTLLIDTTIDYGTISGRSYATITTNTEVPYTGSGSYWSVTPEWTSIP
jgi:hypothetical protein